MAFKGNPVHVLVVPGLHDSGPTHWQTWLASHFRHAQRVEQDDWGQPDLPRWSQRVRETLAQHPGVSWVAVGHSFGCLALVHAVGSGAVGIDAALLVAPADPHKFSVASSLPTSPLCIPSVMLGSETDPWMRLADARAWAQAWGSRFTNLGDVGHINTESGFGPLPPAKEVVHSLIHRTERARRLQRVQASELSFAV